MNNTTQIALVENGPSENLIIPFLNLYINIACRYF